MNGANTMLLLIVASKGKIGTKGEESCQIFSDIFKSLDYNGF